MALRLVRDPGHGQASQRGSRPRLRLVRGGKQDQARVVAQVLSDGSVRQMAGTKAWDTRSPSGWREGTVSGEGWTLWWEHRPWTAKTA